MKALHWLETKQLDRVTNFSTETECINNIKAAGEQVYYYCSFRSKKVYYGLEGNIKYLGVFRNKYIKYLEFRLLVVLKTLHIVVSSNDNVLMVNQDLVGFIMPALWINKILRRHNRFVLDVRTLPTVPETFEKDMSTYEKQIHAAVSYFDGLSFITPFLEKVSLKSYKEHPKTVNWSSGVNVALFDASMDDYQRDTDAFRIFYHGGISISRGNMDLINACERVINQGYHIELIQIGKIVDKELKTYIKERHLESWCKLYDSKPLEEMPALVAKCDLPVLPFPNFMAWRVSSPIKLMEYLAMGKPVLASNMECFTDILPKDKGIVYYYEANAENVVEEMACAIIERVKKHQPQPYFVKSDECIKFVSIHFTWKAQTNKLLKFSIDLCRRIN